MQLPPSSDDFRELSDHYTSEQALSGVAKFMLVRRPNLGHNLGLT